MPNMICNGGFEDGLSYWTQFNGVESIEADVLGSRVRMARIPPLGELNQYLGDRTATGDLHFFWYSLGNTFPALAVSIYYADGTHHTYALTVENFHQYPLYWADLRVDRAKPVRSIRLRNPLSEEFSTSGVNCFTLNGDEARACLVRRARARAPGVGAWLEHNRQPEASAPAGPPGWMASPEEDDQLAAHLFEIDLKLDRLLVQMQRSEQRSAVSAPIKEPAPV